MNLDLETKKEVSLILLFLLLILTITINFIDHWKSDRLTLPVSTEQQQTTKTIGDLRH